MMMHLLLFLIIIIAFDQFWSYLSFTRVARVEVVALHYYFSLPLTFLSSLC